MRSHSQKVFYISDFFSYQNVNFTENLVFPSIQDITIRIWIATNIDNSIIWVDKNMLNMIFESFLSIDGKWIIKASSNWNEVSIKFSV